MQGHKIRGKTDGKFGSDYSDLYSSGALLSVGLDLREAVLTNLTRC